MKTHLYIASSICMKGDFPTKDRKYWTSLAWAIDLKMEQRSFGENGPGLHWWRGFRDRHPELSSRKAGNVDRCRVSNATEENMENDFDVLEQIICDNDLQSRPHLIFNCDETAIILNKSVERVRFPHFSDSDCNFITRQCALYRICCWMPYSTIDGI